MAIAPLLLGQDNKIVVVGLSSAQMSELREVVPGVRIVAGLPPAAQAVTAVTPDAPAAVEQKQKLLEEVADADAFIGGPTREVIRAGRKFKWV